MEIEIFDDMEQCTADEVGRMLPLVSEQRREQALKFRFTFGQYACLKAAVMLQGIIARMRPDIPLPLTFNFNEHEKPFLADHPELFFNISHCKNGIAAVVADHPVGIDIECFHDAEHGLLEKTMNPEERQQIVSSKDPAVEFTRLWTRKEAVLKLRGTGITDNLSAVLSGPEQVETTVNPTKHYAWSVAVRPKN